MKCGSEKSSVWRSSQNQNKQNFLDSQSIFFYISSLIRRLFSNIPPPLSLSYTHTFIYMCDYRHIYLSMCVCACVYVCECVNDANVMVTVGCLSNIYKKAFTCLFSDLSNHIFRCLPAVVSNFFSPFGKVTTTSGIETICFFCCFVSYFYISRQGSFVYPTRHSPMPSLFWVILGKALKMASDA